MYAVRRYKRKEESLRRQKMAEAICENNTRDFFREIKRVKAKRHVAPSIDGKVTSEEISQLFAAKYEGLYNSVPSELDRLRTIEAEVNKKCENCKDTDRVVSLNDVTDALTLLKANKSDGDVGLFSTHLLMSSELFRDQLAKLITAILTHGHQPKTVLLATIASIPKDNRGNICDSNNYRGITLCSSISKLIELIIMKRYGHLLHTSDMQYAYKKKSSTAVCSLVVKEIINYYANNGSEVYSCSVDATKAFDRVQHDQLFEMLIERDLPSIVVRVIVDMYKRQQMRTVWNKKYSETFQTGNGVRQGGVISPVLFCVYMDHLLHRLENAGVGCWFGNSYYGAIGYADDLVLLSPTGSGLQRMLSICEEFGDKYGVQYNAKKTMCILFSKRSVSKPVIRMCGADIKWVDSVKHLGNTLLSNLSESSDVKYKKGDMIQRVNTSLASLDGSDDRILLKVFNSQCAHLYGTTSWNFQDKSVKEFVTAWNRCVRRLLRLPFMTHTRYLPHLLGSSGVTDQIYSRFVKMCNSIRVSENQRLKFLFESCVRHSRSIIGGNLRVVAKRLGMSISKVLCDGASQLNIFYLQEGADTDVIAINLIKEIRSTIREREMVLPGFDVAEMNELLTFICTNAVI
jgi:hypothetical protein